MRKPYIVTILGHRYEPNPDGSTKVTSAAVSGAGAFASEDEAVGWGVRRFKEKHSDLQIDSTLATLLSDECVYDLYRAALGLPVLNQED